LNAATLGDVVAFHRTYYRPDNAVLVVAGDIDSAQTDAWVERYFGAIATPSEAIPRVHLTEPAQTAERRFTYRAANVPLPAIEYAYHIPAANHPDAAVLDVVETLLGAGKSSRLYRSLVYGSQLASLAYANADLREQPGLFSLRLVAAAGKALADARAALDAEIALLCTAPPSNAELERVKTQIMSYFVRGRQTYNGIALALVRAATERNDPSAVNTDLERYLAVSGADVQRVAQAYFRPENRSVVDYLPQ
jgi:zinc protease